MGRLRQSSHLPARPPGRAHPDPRGARQKIRTHLKFNCIAVVGPTASGKSAVALELARRANGEIINADSRQIYRALDAATGKPSSADRQIIPHHLYDILDPNESYSAGRYARDAEQAFHDITARKHLPIFVGGTGLYLKALFEGLAAMPPRNDAVRERLRKEAEERGRAALHERLKSVDPVAAAKIPPENIQRVIRALEVYETTGKPISAWHAEQPAPQKPFQPLKVGLSWGPAALRRRIEERSRLMVPALLEETRHLLARGYGRSDPGLQSLGYRESVDCLEGRASAAELQARLITDTLQYAKRQRTWFRADSDIHWIPVQEPLDATRAARAILEHLI